MIRDWRRAWNSAGSKWRVESTCKHESLFTKSGGGQTTPSMIMRAISGRETCSIRNAHLPKCKCVFSLFLCCFVKIRIQVWLLLGVNFAPPNGWRLSCRADNFQNVLNESSSFTFLSNPHSTSTRHAKCNHAHSVSLSRWLGRISI